MPPIKGQSILVIGGSSGIGFAAAKLAALEGVKVAIASSNQSRVEDAVKRILTAVPDAQVTGFTADLSQVGVEEHIVKLLTEVTESHGGLLDHIILTAGIINLVPLANFTEEYFYDSSHLRVLTPIILGKLAPQFIHKKPTSSLIFTGGAVIDRPLKGFYMGAAWCGFLFASARGLAVELAPIRVNAVSPGATLTELQGPPSEMRDKRIAAYTEKALLGKLGEPEEVGEAYVYLMKDSNTTGSIVNTSGGALFYP